MRWLSLMMVVGMVAACDETASLPASALSLPIDFAFACEGSGDGRMLPPENDETAASLNDTRMCPDVDGAQGELWGVALNRQPPGLIVMQMNPAAGTRGFIDADFFRPGTSSIPVGQQPIQVLAADDHSAFYVLSAGDQRVDRVVIDGRDEDGLHFTTTSIPLPGVPSLGVMLGPDLLVAARDEPTIWSIPTDEAGTPEVVSLKAPGRILHLAGIDGDEAHVIATFRDRKTVAILSSVGAIVAEAGVVPQCRDGLDNDGANGSDKDDPNCLDANDDDESTATGESRADAVVPPAVELATDDDVAPSCSDNLDNDDDGLTDGDDEGCPASELVSACNDGIDNDGDELVDGDDESCYSEFGNSEIQLPDDGPFHPTFIDAGAAGKFVYVLDERLGQVLVFATDGTTLTRVDANADGAPIPDLESRPFGDTDGEVEIHKAVPNTKMPALERRGLKNIEILEGNAFSLSSSRLRGELWERIIAPANPGEQPTVSLSPNDAEWKPDDCSPDNTTACEQPLHDDETWMLFGANLEGRMQLIEAVRRGVPVHRLAQRELDLHDRGGDVTTPRLTLRGRLINARGEPQEGFPFIGAALEELIQEEVEDVSPPKLRRFGVWPAADFEEMPSESWTLTFEGQIPGASGRLGALVADPAGAVLVDPTNTFCDDGVEAGDWVQLELPTAGLDLGLQHQIEVVLDSGETCQQLAKKVSLVELQVTEVREGTLVVSLTGARVRPSLPVLDETTIRGAGLSMRACSAKLDELDDVLGLPENLKPVTVDLTKLPERVAYNVRGQGWVLVGSRSGFLHRQRWDRTGTGTCTEDTSIDVRLDGRPQPREGTVAKFSSCPPPAEELTFDEVVKELAPAESRFENPSFGLDVFPACTIDAEGVISERASQQDTTFSFDVTGPYQGSALSLANSILIDRVPQLDFRRQQIQLDGAAKRASILQLRIGDPRVIATFE